MQTPNRTWALYVSIAVLVFPLVYLVLKNKPMEAVEPEKQQTVIQPPVSDSVEVRFQSLVAAGLTALNAKNYMESIRSFQTAVNLKPGNDVALNDLGFAWCQQGDFAQAVPYFKQALAANPNFQLAKNNLAWAEGVLKKK